MYAYVNNRHSCYADSVLVAMFAPSDAFTFLLDRPRTRVAGMLDKENTKMLNLGLDNRGTTCESLRLEMGEPWSTPFDQSAVDFFHALLDMCGATHLGTQIQTLVYRPKDETKPVEVRTMPEDTFRAHVAVAGIHDHLSDVFHHVLHTDSPSAESKSILTTISLIDAPSLVFEVGRNDSTADVGYGYTRGDGAIYLDVDETEYMLISVVCRKNNHYTTYVWLDEQWHYHDGMKSNGRLTECDHLEVNNVPPSRYGELFFYVET